jgi:putative selenate reductase
MPDDPFRMTRFSQTLETPIGTAAGPHTQLTQNIVAAWLCGARYIELKTIQTLDELEVSKPCIDMQDEGYNCEWSQELKITESFDQYLNAWIMVHLLQDKFNREKGQNIGTIFNMSIGYNMNGILNENVQWFLNRMNDCRQQKIQKLNEIRDIYPGIEDIIIPDRISDNVTLSTMHGCPPGEIEKICKYLIEEKKLHTIIKLNPTLLGKVKVNEIIQNSGFNITVPDEAFEHDLQYDDAIKIIQNLQTIAAKNNVHFGIKLSNTLECLNSKTTLPPDEKILYMSGRALHPFAVFLAVKLQNDFHGQLDISFSAGVNTFNIHKVLSCGLMPATVCSDLLKPGGYGLLNQYLITLSRAMKLLGANNLAEYILKSSGKNSFTDGVLENLNNYAGEIQKNKDYRQNLFHRPDIKTNRQLGAFDCIKAPCTEACPADQAIPDYLFYTSKDEIENAFRSIFLTNPFPNTTGMVCDHFCQTKCTRINYDDPLLIREIKRFVAENYKGNDFSTAEVPIDKSVAILGAGPSGLACAYYLNLAGFRVEVFEAKSRAGGMVDEVIPEFRLKPASLFRDIENIENTGVEINYNSSIDHHRFHQIRQEYDFVNIATGAWSSRKFIVEGIDSTGVIDPLEFLSKAKRGIKTGIGKNIAVIGGGNTAMDVARTALRLSGKEGRVTVIYRRSVALMPAGYEEIKALIDEGISILDLTLPVRVNTINGRVESLTCIKNSLEVKQGSARPAPVEIPGSDFEIKFDTVIPAIGQDAVVSFMENDLVISGNDSFETSFSNVFISGDSKRGGSTVIQAIADGKKIASIILDKCGYGPKETNLKGRQKDDFIRLMINRMKKQKAAEIQELNLKARENFEVTIGTLDPEKAKAEASRCLKCDELCNICVTVCPNLACFSYRIEPFRFDLQKIVMINGSPELIEDKTFLIEQPYQILHIADWCNECGNCSTFCPTSGAPYIKKPKLFINKKSFDNFSKGYYFENEKQILNYKDNNIRYSILRTGDYYTYTVNSSEVILHCNTFKVIGFKLNVPQVITLLTAVEMSVILSGAIEFWKGKNI